MSPPGGTRQGQVRAGLGISRRWGTRAGHAHQPRLVRQPQVKHNAERPGGL